MSNLFSAEFHRLLHFKLYYIKCVFFMLFPIYFILFNAYSIPPSVDSFMFQTMPFMGIGSAVFVSQFIGEEYLCGTIRNKIFTGYTRTMIYLSELILHFLASVNVLNISIMSVIVSGAIRRCEYKTSFNEMIKCYAVCICTLFFISSLSVLVSLLNKSHMASLMILFWLGFGALIMGNDFYHKLHEPERRLPNEVEIEEGQTDPLPNVLYISGKMRKIHEIMLFANPYGQACYETELMYDRYEEFNWSKVSDYPHLKIFLYSMTESVALTVIGIWLFKKKEIK